MANRKKSSINEIVAELEKFAPSPRLSISSGLVVARWGDNPMFVARVTSYGGKSFGVVEPDVEEWSTDESWFRRELRRWKKGSR